MVSPSTAGALRWCGSIEPTFPGQRHRRAPAPVGSPVQDGNLRHDMLHFLIHRVCASDVTDVSHRLATHLDARVPTLIDSPELLAQWVDFEQEQRDRFGQGRYAKDLSKFVLRDVAQEAWSALDKFLRMLERKSFTVLGIYSELEMRSEVLTNVLGRAFKGDADLVLKFRKSGQESPYFFIVDWKRKLPPKEHPVEEMHRIQLSLYAMMLQESPSLVDEEEIGPEQVRILLARVGPRRGGETSSIRRMSLFSKLELLEIIQNMPSEPTPGVHCDAVVGCRRFFSNPPCRAVGALDLPFEAFSGRSDSTNLGPLQKNDVHQRVEAKILNDGYLYKTKDCALEVKIGSRQGTLVVRNAPNQGPLPAGSILRVEGELEDHEDGILIKVAEPKKFLVIDP